MNRDDLIKELLAPTWPTGEGYITRRVAERLADHLAPALATLLRAERAAGYAQGSADRWRCAEEYFNAGGQCGPDSWDCHCANPHLADAVEQGEEGR